jgi:AraC-like DNA-binding protein
MLPLIFRLNASELSNRVEYLEAVLPGTSSFIKNQMDEQTDFGKARRLLDTFFLRLPGKGHFNADQRFFMALRGILQTAGNLRIETDLDTGISSRQLRRLFEYYIGDTAKAFSMIIRFQHILRASVRNSGDKKLFYDAGYYDQAHFIREFSNFYGETPGKTFGW